MAGEPASATFETTVTATGNNTGIVVPEEVIEQLGAGKRPALLVNLNGYEYRTTAGVMGGRHMVSVSAAVRKATGLGGGDPVRVTLTVAGLLLLVLGATYERRRQQAREAVAWVVQMR